MIIMTHLVLPYSQNQLLKALHVHQVKDRAPDCQGYWWEGWLCLCPVHELLDLCNTPGPQGGTDGNSDGGSDPGFQDSGVQGGQVINSVVTQQTQASCEPGAQSSA